MTSVDGYHASQPRTKATLESSGQLFLVDTGSSVSILPVGLVQNDLQTCHMPISLQTAAGTSIRVHGEVTREIHMMATNDSEPTVFLQKFIVADGTTEVIFGSDFLSNNNMVVSVTDRALRYRNNLFSFSCVSDRFRVVLSHDACFSKNQKEIIACGRGVSSDSVFSPSSDVARDVGILPAYSIVHITESMLPVRLLQAQPSARLKMDIQLDMWRRWMQLSLRQSTLIQIKQLPLRLRL